MNNFYIVRVCENIGCGFNVYCDVKPTYNPISDEMVSFVPILSEFGRINSGFTVRAMTMVGVLHAISAMGEMDRFVGAMKNTLESVLPDPEAFLNRPVAQCRDYRDDDKEKILEWLSYCKEAGAAK